MTRARAGLNVLAIFAILFVLGFGFVANAAPGVATSGSSTDGRSSPQPAAQGPTAIGAGLSFALVPTPVYMRQQVPANYPFKQGGALIVMSGDQLQLRTSFLGMPGASFSTIVQTAGENITAGVVTTGPDGGGVLRSNVTLSPGTYAVGLLVFLSGGSGGPVALSIPRQIQITLPSGSQGSTESTTTTANTTSPSQVSGGSQAVRQLQFVPLPGQAVTKGYPYGRGGGGFAVVGGTITFSLAFSGQSPDALFSLVASVNGTARAIGNYTTDANGDGHIAAATRLGTGTFVLSLSVVDLTTFAAPTPVLVSVPPTFTVEANGISTPPAPPSNATATRGPVWAFKLQPAALGSVPAGYRFATSGTAVVSFDARSSLFGVVLGFQNANPSTTYYADLVLNGTSSNLGSMTTNRDGGVELQSSVQANPGTYQLGIAVYDVSDVAAFNASAPVLVMVSDPETELVVVGPLGAGGPATTLAINSTSSQSSSSSTITTAATTESAGTKVESQIQDALNNLTIPAAVQVTPLASSSDVYDSRFSLSVGQQGDNGLVIAISGENVTGPRVLLINMSRTDPLSLYPALNVTLDGIQVTEASSALQVLDPISTNPPYYVLVATSDSIQLLISIPHFSLHLIQVAGVIVHAVQTSLQVDTPLLLGSIFVITLAFAGVYSARKRYFTMVI